MSFWESLAFGTFEAWLIQAVKNPVSAKAVQLRVRLVRLRDLLNDAFKAWGWE